MVLPRQRHVHCLADQHGASRVYTHVVSSLVAGVESFGLHLSLLLASVQVSYVTNDFQ